MPDEKSNKVFVDDEGHPVNKDGEKLYEGRDGDKKTWDELDDAEESYYDSKAYDEFIDISTYCTNYDSDSAVDWGSGEDGSRTEDDWDSLPIVD
jgi:hypothetical protein